MQALSLRGVTPAVLVVVASVGSLLGCGGSGGGSSRSGSTAAPSTSSTRTNTPGSVTSRTTSTPATTPITSLAKNGPTITITAPARGAFLTQPVAKVEGKV